MFRAFADIVEKAKEEVVVIDTAPTGHTLLLLDAAQSYHKEIARSTGEVPQSVQKLTAASSESRGNERCHCHTGRSNACS
ncbi:hypothetical protein GCM10020331_093430 [Ectobacillus funiculus]